VGVVVDRLCRNDDIDVRGEALIERRNRLPTDKDVWQISVNNGLQRIQQLVFAFTEAHAFKRGSSWDASISLSYSSAIISNAGS
jgi:hypothetical protein